MLVLLLSTLWCMGGYSQETVTDELTKESLGLKSSYSPFSANLTSGAVYIGSAYAGTGKGYHGIQIRTSGSTSGIVTKSSVGKIKSISIDFNKDCKGISVYGKNTAYDLASDLFNSKKQGDLIQNVKYSSSGVEIIPSSDYKYVGFCSNEGTAFIDKITIVWEKESSKTPTTTTFGDNVDNHTVTVIEGEAFPTHVATMTTAGVAGTIAYASDNAAVKVDQNNGVTSAGTGFGKAKITATFTPTDTKTYASSSAYYYIDYKEKTKPATAIFFDKSNVTLTTLDYASFTGQTATLKAGETILTNELTYSKEDAAGVITTLNNNDGTLVLSGNEGTATVTATFNGSAEYASSTASYTITVVDPNKLDVTFDFTKPDLYGYDVPVSGSGTSLEEGNTINSGVVTITNVKSGGNGTNTTKSVFHNKKGAITLRFYINAEATVSVPVGYEINKIEFVTGNNASDNITITPGNYDSNASTWTGSANTVSLTFNDAVWFTSMTVYYAKVDLPTVTFDEEKDDNLSNYDKKTVDVTMTRTIGTGYLNPVCFPFAMDATQITEVFGEGSKVSAMAEDMPDGNLHFDYVETMEAGMPYLVEPTKASTKVEVKNVTINAKPGYDVAADNGGNLYSFQGTFNPYAFTAIDGTELFLGKNNTLYMPQSVGQKMKGFRAYFTTPKANESLKIVVNGQATTISSLMSGKTMTGKVYNLNGQYVGTSLEGLAKGVYVMNGQKFVVK